MAVEMSFEDDATGAVAVYHRISEAVFDCVHEQLIVTVHGYPSELTAGSKQPLSTVVLRIPFIVLAGDARQFLYPLIQKWSGSPFIDAVAKLDPNQAITDPSVPELLSVAVNRPPKVAPKPSEAPTP